MLWFEVFGWVGSLLVVASLMQARVLRFRWLNLVGATIATVYNAAFEIWPFAVMNGVIAVIDVYWLWRLLRERHDERAYEVVDVGDDDAYLRHFLRVHADDLARFHPSFEADATGPRTGLLVVRGDETVGVVVVADAGEGLGRVELDYVTPRFRDFTPGEFVYRRSGALEAHGFERLETDSVAGESTDYLERVGFRRAGERWVLQLAA